MSVSHSPREGVSDGASFLMSVAVFVVGIGLGGWYLWQEQHAAISWAAMQILHGQMSVIHLFSDRFDTADSQLLAADPAKVEFGRLVRLAREVGRFYLAPSVGLVLVLAAICAGRAGAKRFSRLLDLEGLIRDQAETFRTPTAFFRRRLGLTEIAAGEPRPADRALSAREWIDRWAKDEAGAFSESAAQVELTRQLGARASAPEAAPAHVRCLLAVFALHRARRREEARRLLGDLSDSLRPKAKEAKEGPTESLRFPDALVARADALLAARELRGPLCAIMERHGFTTTGAMSVLLAARKEGGVLPPAQFGFLKLVDRRLWYALHSLGFPDDIYDPTLHPTPRVEALGARDHWARERIAGEALRVASVEGALAAILEAAGESAICARSRPAASTA